MSKDNLIELIDYSAENSKVKPWKEHKTGSLKLSDSYYRRQLFTVVDRLSGCGEYLRFKSCPHGHEKKLDYASFCKHRLCPMCAWRRSLKTARQVGLICNYLTEVRAEKVRWIFLTLTVKNCHGRDLNDTITKMMKAFHRMFSRKTVSKKIYGWFRSLEVTRNADTGMFHPHFHVLMCVKPLYFRQGYMKQEEWSDIWKQSMKLDYTPIVDIRIVKAKAKKGSILPPDQRVENVPVSAIAEISKYSVKSKDYILEPNKEDLEMFVEQVRAEYGHALDEQAIYERAEHQYKWWLESRMDNAIIYLDQALTRRRTFAFGGILKEIYQILIAEEKVQEIERMELIDDDHEETCKCSTCQAEMVEEIFNWYTKKGNYYKKIVSSGQEDTK